MMVRLTIVMVALIAAIDIFSQKHIEFSEIPTWVKQIDYPKESNISKYDIKGGVYFKLVDYQSNLSIGESFSHFVQKVVSSGGVTNASQVQVNFDTAYQDLSIHYLRVIRDDQIIDKSNISFEFIKNESQLSSNIYTGRVTALAVLEDVRKGDVIEFAYSTVGENPVFDKERFVLFPLEDINPIDRMYTRILYPNNSGFVFKSSKQSKENIEEGISNELNELIYDLSDLEALELEETTPPWIIPYSYLMVSSTNSWKEVNDWSLGLFDSNKIELVNQVFEEIFYDDYSLDDKINAIIDFVQDDIRYMGIETGMGSIMPFSPDQVITQRFGDCKDKSLLMTVLLKEIGIEKCYPVLVSTWLEQNVNDMLPNGQLFDHVIVYFEHKGSGYWVDPTSSYQGGNYKTLKTYDYGKVLIVREGETSLTKMNLSDNTSITEIDEYFDGSSFDNPGTLLVKTRLKDAKADYTRQILEYYSKKELAESYKYYYSLAYPSLQELKKLAIKDDLKQNEIFIEENYQIDNFWNDNMEGYKDKYTFTYEPTALYGYLGGIACEEKQFPVAQNFPHQLKMSTVIDFPDPISINLEEKEYDNEAFLFSKRIELVDPKRVKLEYVFSSKTKEISPEYFKEVCADINEILDALPIVFYFPKSRFDPTEFFKNQYIIQLKNVPLKNSNYYIEEIVNKNKSLSGIIGLINLDEDKLTTAVFYESLEKELSSYFKNNLMQNPSSIPLTLTINELRVSENIIDKSNRRAVVDFSYKVSYTKNDELFEYELIDKIETPGKYLQTLHESNIRLSLQKLMNALNEDVFVKAKTE
jgi:transglutaminase-like putative cysteine protease